jgi:hypothetical protein
MVRKYFGMLLVAMAVVAVLGILPPPGASAYPIISCKGKTKNTTFTYSPDPNNNGGEYKYGGTFSMESEVTCDPIQGHVNAPCWYQHAWESDVWDNAQSKWVHDDGDIYDMRNLNPTVSVQCAGAAKKATCSHQMQNLHGANKTYKFHHLLWYESTNEAGVVHEYSNTQVFHFP